MIEDSLPNDKPIVKDKDKDKSKDKDKDKDKSKDLVKIPFNSSLESFIELCRAPGKRAL